MYLPIDLGPGALVHGIDEDGIVVGEFSETPSTYGAQWTAAYWDLDAGTFVDLSQVVGRKLMQAVAIAGGRILALDGQRPWQARVGSNELLEVPLKGGDALNAAGVIAGYTAEFRAATAIAGADTATPIELPWELHLAGDINDAGTVIGRAEHSGMSFAWQRTQHGELQVITSGPDATARAIDSDGRVVGSVSHDGFLYQPGAGLTSLTAPLGWRVGPTDIAAGRHIGVLYGPSGVPSRGYVGHGTMLSDLTELVIGATDDLLIASPRVLNGRGWIGAHGLLGGEPRAYVLRPIAPPAGIGALAVITHILHGGVLGDGGVGIRGGGPRPIPPHEWFRGLSAPQRDALVGAAMDELCEVLDDRTTRAMVHAIALERARAGLESTLARAQASAKALDDDAC